MEWILAAVFAVLSVVLLSGHGSFLIAGYNTASKKEKARYDEKKLCRLMGAGVGVIALLILLLAVFQEDPPSWLSVVFPAAFFLDLAFLLVGGNTICRVKQPGEKPESLVEKKRRYLSSAAALLFVGVILTAVGVLLFTGDVRIEVTEGEIRVDGSYWADYQVGIDEIQEVSLEEGLELGRRTGGLGSMKLLEGNFTNGEFGKYILYAYVKCKSYVVLKTPQKTVVLNQETPEATEELYETVREAIS